MYAALFLYHFVSYTIGLPALFLSILLNRRSKGHIHLFFFVTTLAFALLVILGGTSLLFRLSGREPEKLFHFFQWGMHLATCLALSSFPVLTFSIFPVPGKTFPLSVFPVIGCVVFVVMTILNVLGYFPAAHYITMSVFLVVCAGPMVWILVRYRSSPQTPWRKFCFVFVIIGVFLAPVYVLVDFYNVKLADDQWQTLQQTQPLVLPLVYFVWNFLYVLIHIKSLSSNDALSLPDEFADAFKLTAREREVARLLIGGKSYKEMEFELSVGLSTVKTHIQNIYKKTETGNKVDLIQSVVNYGS